MALLTLENVASALFSGEGYSTHVRTLAYFVSFLSALAMMLSQFPWARALHERTWLLLCAPYSLVALFATWRLILIFMIDFQVHN